MTLADESMALRLVFVVPSRDGSADLNQIRRAHEQFEGILDDGRRELAA
jgi:hypothetical protein